MEDSKIAQTTSLIDSGATICCIDLHFCRRMKWPLEKLYHPLYARNADGTHNSRGMIWHQVKLTLRIDGRNAVQNFFVLNLGKKDNIILGYPWLARNNPQINWAARKVHMVRMVIPCHDDPRIVEQHYLLWYLRAMERNESEYAAWLYAQQRNMATLWKVLGEDHPHIQKLTLSTALAQAAGKVEQKLPLQYSKYAKVFDKPKDRKLPLWYPFNHAIDLKETFIPKVAKSYLMNPEEIKVCKEFIDEHLKSGKIQKSQSPQASPFCFVQKKDGGLHPCQDYQYLNEHAVKNAHPLPLISTLINKLKGAKYFSKMDIQCRYNNIHIKEGDEWKATLTTPYSLYEPLVMFFGQCNSPPTFQAFIDSTFGNMIAEGWLITYMDDVLVYAETKEECQEQTKQVLKRMEEEDLHLKLTKCAFDQTEMEYLGLVVKDREVLMDPTKLKAIEQWELPTLVKAVRSFIGFCNFYWKFIPNFSALACPLHDLTKKGVTFQWGKEQDDTFIKLKEIFISAPVIKMPDTTKPFFVMMDASLMASGGVLMQKDSNRDYHPCTYHSATFSPAEWNYNIYDRELLTIIQALKEWHHYLTGTEHPVVIITDHKHLGYFKQTQNLTWQQARWWFFLQEYDIKWGVEHGINMRPADTLSRKDEVNTSDDNREITLLKGNDQYFYIWAIDATLAQKIHQSSTTDLIITKALTAMNDKTGEPWIPRTTKADWKFEDGALYFKHQLYVPEPACHDLIKSLHELPTRGHKGFFHMLHHMQKEYW